MKYFQMSIMLGSMWLMCSFLAQDALIRGISLAVASVWTATAIFAHYTE